MPHFSIMLLLHKPFDPLSNSPDFRQRLIIPLPCCLDSPQTVNPTSIRHIGRFPMKEVNSSDSLPQTLPVDSFPKRTQSHHAQEHDIPWSKTGQRSSQSIIVMAISRTTACCRNPEGHVESRPGLIRHHHLDDLLLALPLPRHHPSGRVDGDDPYDDVHRHRLRDDRP